MTLGGVNPGDIVLVGGMSHEADGNGHLHQPLVVVRVEDTVEPRLTARSGTSYESPPRPREQAMTLVRLVLGCASDANGEDGDGRPRSPAGDEWGR